jgi:hypothetical protein
MEVSDVRRRVLGTIERARRSAAERRERADEAAKEYELFLERIAIPLFRQVASALKPEGYPFTVFTPGGSVRLMSDRNAEDYIELTLDTAGERPAVVGHSRRARGSRVVESEYPLGNGPLRELTEDQVLAYLLRELEPFVDR